MTGHDDATLRQIAAARPDRSTWLSANAGSGKTKVLTDRVARLLLEGVNPQHILCLTYTKAAATEMQNRLFKRLGHWAMLEDEALETELRGLGHDLAITGDTLNRARRLFASAIETPGGLKIQTIHSFCSALLRRFPLEARVSPQFSEMEDRAAALLRAEIVEEIAAGPRAEALYALARHFTGETLDDLTGEIVRNRAWFATPLTDDRIAGLFGQPPGLCADDLSARVFLGGEDALLRELVAALSKGGPRDGKAASMLAQVAVPGVDALPVLEDVFLTGATAKAPFCAKIGSFPTKACREAITHILPRLEAFMARVEAARGPRLALAAMERTKALHDFAHVFLPRLEAAKTARGWLDFDDLILRARDLLTDRQVADWVLYKLDGGLDHILVDEAQDTSPAQWEVIERLAREFTSGSGARPETTRTIFVVGDKKQSIYSFQGADPEAFDRMKAEFASRLSNLPLPLHELGMEVSFRSAPAILDVVDACFKGHEKSGFLPDQSHKAHKTAMPGRVDLWPAVKPPETGEDPEWYDPVDVKSPGDPATVLARRIAGAIHDMIETPLPDAQGTGARPIQPGDILILVQRRSEVFHDIIRECKALGLPVAGADRLKVGAELAVKDLAALLSFLATPEDSLSLATVLRSPLFGWSEDALFRLAHDRGQDYLWAELRDRAGAYPETMAVLHDLLDQVDFLRPYELIERVLTRHDGRRKLLARLGPEAEDGIDALLSQAMAYERNAVDSLTGFLVWMETDDLEIKRQMDSAGNRIRVMTVHGAKGLEAPIVILPDTARRPLRLRNQMARVGGSVIWRMPAAEAPGAQAAADDAARATQQAERDRLLYVALTRAEQWLIVATAGDPGKAGESWYQKVRAGLERLGAEACSFGQAPGLRYERGAWRGLAARSPETPKDGVAPLPGFFAARAPAPAVPPPALSPSDLGGAKALTGEEGLDEEAAKRRGRQLHRLLEHLAGTPEGSWPETAALLLGTGPDAAADMDLTGLIDEAGRVLTEPALRPVFAPGALVEVPVSANLDTLGGRRIHGVIDRLLIEPGRVLAVDFKTNAVVPDRPEHCPEGLLRQMGAYAEALAQIYPQRRIDTALLWTRSARLMTLPHDLVRRALHDTHIP